MAKKLYNNWTALVKMGKIEWALDLISEHATIFRITVTVSAEKGACGVLKLVKIEQS